MKMNLPNKLTVLRMIMVPFFCFFYLTSLVPEPAKYWISLAIFALASYTDHLDGKIAREQHLITDFGKFMDPLADKLLVCSAFICFVESGQVPAWMTIILIGREFIISGFRLVAAGKGVVIAANMWGKIKTVVQMAAVIAILLPLSYDWLVVLRWILLYASVALTIISVVDYIVLNAHVLKESDE